MTKVALDTVILAAIIDTNDKWHQPALGLRDALNVKSVELNFHDVLIALACREMEIPYIASYDRDFDKINWLTRIDSPTNVP